MSFFKDLGKAIVPIATDYAAGSSNPYVSFAGGLFGGGGGSGPVVVNAPVPPPPPAAAIPGGVVMVGGQAPSLGWGAAAALFAGVLGLILLERNVGRRG